MESLRVTRRISELSPEEARALAEALYGLRRLALDRARRGQWRDWHRLKLVGSSQYVSVRARPGPYGYRTELLLYGKRPRPEKNDAVALAKLAGLQHFVVEELEVVFLVREASYAGVKPSELAAATA